MQKYQLPPLPYPYNALEPVISEQIMNLHHTKHHQAYVNGANAALEKIEKASRGELTIDMRAVLRDLSFNLDGHKLHTVFWPNMAPPGKGGGKPGGSIADRIDKEFNGFESFKKLFSDAAKTVEGAGWALLLYDPETDRLVMTQIEKQNLMHLAQLPILLSLDVWEHAYYLQYKNDRASYVDAWWQVVNWDDVDKRFSKARV